MTQLCGVDIPEVSGSDELTDNAIEIISPSVTDMTGSPSSPGKTNRTPPSDQGDGVTLGGVDGQGSEVGGEGKGQGSVVYQQQQQVILQDEFNVLQRNMQNVSLEQVKYYLSSDFEYSINMKDLHVMDSLINGPCPYWTLLHNCLNNGWCEVRLTTHIYRTSGVLL